ncbi:sulfotransferase [Pseudomonadota bacterium]
MKLLDRFNKYLHKQKNQTEYLESSPVLPNLLILGFPKCGTHALLHNLAHHPHIHTHPNELSFFGNKNKSLEEYMALFQSDKKYNGEKTPYYVLRKDAMQQISELIPNAKLFICIRHPIQTVHSFYNFRIFEYKNGFPHGFNPEEYSFEDIVLDDLDAKQFNIYQCCYIDHIRKNVLRYFPIEQIYFVIQERMMNFMTREMNKIYNHLNLPPYETNFEIKIKLHNDQFQYGSIDYSSPRYHRALEKLSALYKPYNKELFDFLGTDIVEWEFFDKMYNKLMQ